MYEQGWSRDLHIRWASMYKHKGTIIVTERNSYLAKINPNNGKLSWEVKIKNVYGWITAYNDRVYFLDQGGLLKIINFETGKIEREHQFHHPYLGYITLNDNYLITGSWRGFTDLICFNNNEQLSINWTKPTKSKELISYSLPIIDGNNLIIANHTDKYLIKIDLHTGTEYWKVKLPDFVGELDKDYTFQIFNGKIKVYAKDGKIYSLNEDVLEWQSEINHTCGIITIRPKILQSQYIFQDSENYICSYDINEKKLRWKIYSNHANFKIPAIELEDNFTLIGFNMGRQKIINKNGKIITDLGIERRYGSEFIKINEDIFYLTKSKLKQLKKKRKRLPTLCISNGG